jgi:hypothetical protein
MYEKITELTIFQKEIYIFAESKFIHSIEAITYDKYKNFSLRS